MYFRCRLLCRHPWVPGDYGVAQLVENNVCCDCRAKCGSGSLYCTVHSKMLRLACVSETATFCRLFLPLPAASGCLHKRKDPSAPFVSRHICRMQVPPRCQYSWPVPSGHICRCPWSTAGASQSASFQLSILRTSYESKKVLGDTAVLHAGGMAQPAQAPLLKKAVRCSELSMIKMIIVHSNGIIWIKESAVWILWFCFSILKAWLTENIIMVNSFGNFQHKTLAGVQS